MHMEILEIELLALGGIQEILWRGELVPVPDTHIRLSLSLLSYIFVIILKRILKGLFILLLK